MTSRSDHLPLCPKLRRDERWVCSVILSGSKDLRKVEEEEKGQCWGTSQTLKAQELGILISNTGEGRGSS